MTREPVQLKPTARCTPEELKGLADTVRGIADDIEAGEILAFSWAAHRTEDTFDTNWVKPKGISTLSMIGAAKCLADDMSAHLRSDPPPHD